MGGHYFGGDGMRFENFVNILTGACGEVFQNKKAWFIGEMKFDIKHIIRTSKVPSALKFLAKIFFTAHPILTKRFFLGLQN